MRRIALHTLALLLFFGCSGGFRAGRSATPDIHASPLELLDASRSPAAQDVDWVVYVYMAADNDLDQEAQKDFDKMSTALVDTGQPARIAIVVLLDRLGDTWDGYYELKPGVTLAKAQRSVKTGELHTSDPGTLRAFLDWGEQRYRAANQALLFWSHGQGWRRLGEDDLRRIADQLRAWRVAKARIDKLSGELRTLSLGPDEFQNLAGELRGWRLTDAQIRLVLDGLRFVRASQPRQLTLGSLPIHYDESDKAAPGTPRKRALLNHDAATALHDNELKLLGFDACYMAMIETAYEFRSKAEVMVASEDDLTGWPLDAVITDLQHDSTLSAEGFAEHIVDHVRGNAQVKTLSAIRLSAVQDLADQISALADQLTASMDQHPGWIRRVRRSVIELARGKGVYHIDLPDLLDHLKNDSAGASQGPLIDRVIQAESAVVFANHEDAEHDGRHGLAHAQGLAIYFPPDGASFDQDAYAHGAYDKPRSAPSPVTFVNEQRWADFINRYAEDNP